MSRFYSGRISGCGSFIFLGLVLFGIGDRAWGAVLGLEPFDYSGTALAGQNGGTGWSGAWTGGAVTLSDDGQSLNYPAGVSQATTGGRVLDPIDSADKTTRKLTTGAALGGEGTYFVSYLLHRDATGSATVEFNNSGNSLRWRTGVTATGQLLYGISSDKTSDADFVPADEDILIVSKFEAHASASDVVSIKMFRVNDLIPQSDADVAYDFSTTGSTGVTDNILELTVLSGSVQLDEIRIGTSFEDVVAGSAPEPASAAVAGAAVLMGLARRHRRV